MNTKSILREAMGRKGVVRCIPWVGRVIIIGDAILKTIQVVRECRELYKEIKTNRNEEGEPNMLDLDEQILEKMFNERLDDEDWRYLFN